MSGPTRKQIFPQFVVLPPMESVVNFFYLLTGKPLDESISWSAWNTVDFTWLRAYIRPCHNKILEETINGIQATPCSLLRQLLRPFGYRVELGGKPANPRWILKKIADPNKGVQRQEETIHFSWE